LKSNNWRLRHNCRPSSLINLKNAISPQAEQFLTLYRKPFNPEPGELVPERKIDSFSKFKKGEDFNRRNTLTYFNEQETAVFFKINDLSVHILKIFGTM